MRDEVFPQEVYGSLIQRTIQYTVYYRLEHYHSNCLLKGFSRYYSNAYVTNKWVLFLVEDLGFYIQVTIYKKTFMPSVDSVTSTSLREFYCLNPHHDKD